MIYYTLTQNANDDWSLFILLPEGGSLTARFKHWRQADACIRYHSPRAAELTEAEMWRETMRRELAVCVG